MHTFIAVRDHQFQVVQLETRLKEWSDKSTSMAKVEVLEGRLSAAQEETGTVKEALQKERLENTLRERTIQELERKIKSLEDHQRGLEVILREKQDAEIESDRKFKSLKQKTHRATEKVHTPISHEKNYVDMFACSCTSYSLQQQKA